MECGNRGESGKFRRGESGKYSRENPGGEGGQLDTCGLVFSGNFRDIAMSKALKAAIEANDPAAALKALKTVKDLGRKLPKAEAPVAYAAEQGAEAVLTVLLEAGAPMPPTNFQRLHPFALAADKGHTTV